MPLITIEKASFGYDGKLVLGDVSLAVQEGDFIGLIGENGSGKSTLIKGLTGLLEPMKGSVTHAPGIQNTIGYVPQRGQLDQVYPLTVFDIVEMGHTANRSWHRITTSSDRKIINQHLGKVGMAERAQDSYSSLSGGQQQRVLIARALATHPRILMLDEPTAGVDMIAEEGIMDLLVELNQKENIAILLVTHKIHVLERFAKTVIIAGNNKIRVGPAKELLAPGRLLEIVEDLL